MATTAKHSGNADWEPVREFVTTRDHSRVWTVQRHVGTGALRCNCPAYIFRTRRGQSTCKHIDHVVAHPEAGRAPGTTTAWRDETEAALRRAFVARFQSGKWSRVPEATSSPNDRTLWLVMSEARWRAFVEDVRLLLSNGRGGPAAPASDPVRLGVRRVVLDEDE